MDPVLYDSSLVDCDRVEQDASASASHGNLCKRKEPEDREEEIQLHVSKKVIVCQAGGRHPTRDFIGALRAQIKDTGKLGMIMELMCRTVTYRRREFGGDKHVIVARWNEGSAACFSVLRDEKYFPGGYAYLQDVRNCGVKCPLLFRDSTVDPLQVYCAREHGADAILLMAGLLTDVGIVELVKLCKTLRMAALVEVYDEKEMDRVLAIEGIELIGIHSETFEAGDNRAIKLLEGRRGQFIRDNNILVVGHIKRFNPTAMKSGYEAGVKGILHGD